MQQYEKIIERAWKNRSFKKQLIDAPKATFSNMGYDFGDLEVRIHDDSADTVHFVLLSKSQIRDLDLGSDPVIGKITKRAHEDESYKERLLNDPKMAIREVLGIEPPNNIEIHENTDQVINIVIPANPNTAGELSDTDLSMISGGKGLTINCDAVDGAMNAGGNLAAKVGSFLPGNFGGLFSSLGPILVGGGDLVGKTSSFLGFMGG